MKLFTPSSIFPQHPRNCIKSGGVCQTPPDSCQAESFLSFSRHSRFGHHRLHGRNLGVEIHVRIDIGCRGKTALPRPFLNLLHCHAVCQQHTRIRSSMASAGEKGRKKPADTDHQGGYPCCVLPALIRLLRRQAEYQRAGEGLRTQQACSASVSAAVACLSLKESFIKNKLVFLFLTRYKSLQVSC